MLALPGADGQIPRVDTEPDELQQEQCKQVPH